MSLAKNIALIKKAAHLLAIVLVFGMVLSCEKKQVFNEQEIDFQSAFNNKIVADVDGAEIQLDKVLLSAIWKQELAIDDQVSFDDYQIIKGQYSDTGKDFYQLQTISEDGTISLANVLTIEDGVMRLGETTCKCESKSCTSGCKVTPNGNGCGCSFCSSDCKKTSTASGGDK